MATTLQNLIDAIEADLADSGNATWSAADIEQWSRDAIADYSLHFPLIGQQTIAAVTGTESYDLAGGFLEIISVEYPEGQEPRAYLRRRNRLQGSDCACFLRS